MIKVENIVILELFCTFAEEKPLKFEIFLFLPF